MRSAVLAVTLLAFAAADAAAQTGVGPGGSGLIPGGPAPLGVPGAQIGQTNQIGRFQAVQGPGSPGSPSFMLVDTYVGTAWVLTPSKDANQPYTWVAIGGPNLTPMRNTAR